MSLTPKQRQRLLFTIALVTFGLLAADRVLFTPLFKWWSQGNERIATLQADLAKDRALLEQAKAWQDRLHRIEEAMYRGSDAEIEGALMGQISSQASRYGVAIGTLRPQWQEADAAGPRRLQLRMTASGGTAAVVPFLLALETAPRPVRLSTLVLRAKNETGIELEAESQVEAAVLPAAVSKEAKP